MHTSNHWKFNKDVWEQWTWVWVNSGSWWWTGRPGVLRFMRLQSRTRLSDWTKLNWEQKLFFFFFFLIWNHEFYVSIWLYHERTLHCSFPGPKYVGFGAAQLLQGWVWLRPWRCLQMTRVVGSWALVWVPGWSDISHGSCSSTGSSGIQEPFGTKLWVIRISISFTLYSSWLHLLLLPNHCF